MRWLRSIFGGHERSTVSDGISPDSNVEALELNDLLVLARQLMALSRRRRCAAENMGASMLYERHIDTSLIGWYMHLHHGLSESAIYQAMQKDLVALMHDPSQTSHILQSRVILTNEEEDTYGYGQINPLIFDSDRGALTLRETLYDHLSFPDRVSTIISFDPELRGHRHQIRYFRALLVAYSLAHVLQTETRDPECLKDVTTLLADEQALASGWSTTAQQLHDLSIEPGNFEPDESLLYSPAKVHESAALFFLYGNLISPLGAF